MALTPACSTSGNHQGALGTFVPVPLTAEKFLHPSTPALLVPVLPLAIPQPLVICILPLPYTIPFLVPLYPSCSVCPLHCTPCTPLHPLNPCTLCIPIRANPLPLAPASLAPFLPFASSLLLVTPLWHALCPLHPLLAHAPPHATPSPTCHSFSLWLLCPRTASLKELALASHCPNSAL